MSLPKLSSVVERQAAESVADEAETTFLVASFMALIHALVGCFFQLVLLFAGGGWKPSLCFELLGIVVAGALLICGSKLASCFKSDQPRMRWRLARRIPLFAWFSAVGISAFYAVAREEWILFAWMALLLFAVANFAIAERDFLVAQRRIAIANANYESEMQELMDKLTC